MINSVTKRRRSVDQDTWTKHLYFKLNLKIQVCGTSSHMRKLVKTKVLLDTDLLLNVVCLLFMPYDLKFIARVFPIKYELTHLHFLACESVTVNSSVFKTKPLCMTITSFKKYTNVILERGAIRVNMKSLDRSWYDKASVYIA